jgi:hypothetical protein
VHVVEDVVGRIHKGVLIKGMRIHKGVLLLLAQSSSASAHINVSAVARGRRTRMEGGTASEGVRTRTLARTRTGRVDLVRR